MIVTVRPKNEKKELGATLVGMLRALTFIICGLIVVHWLIPQSSHWYRNYDGQILFPALLFFGHFCFLVTNWIEILPLFVKALAGWRGALEKAASRFKELVHVKSNVNKEDVKCPRNESKPRAEESPDGVNGSFGPAWMFSGNTERSNPSNLLSKTRLYATIMVSGIHVFQVLQLLFQWSGLTNRYRYSHRRNRYRYERKFMKIVRAYEKLTDMDWSAGQQAQYWHDSPDLDMLKKQRSLVLPAILFTLIYLLLRLLKIAHKLSVKEEQTPYECNSSKPEVGSKLDNKEDVDSAWTQVSKPIQPKMEESDPTQASHHLENETSKSGGIKIPCYITKAQPFGRCLVLLAFHDGAFSQGILACFLLTVCHFCWLCYCTHWHLEHNPFFALGIEPTTDLKLIQKAYRRLTLIYHPD